MLYLELLFLHVEPILCTVVKGRMRHISNKYVPESSLQVLNNITLWRFETRSKPKSHVKCFDCCPESAVIIICIYNVKFVSISTHKPAQ